MFIGMRYNLRRDDEVEQALHCVIHTGAEVCGFADYGLTPGRRAEPIWCWCLLKLPPTS